MFGGLSALFYLFGVQLFRDTTSRTQETLKVILLSILTMLALWMGSNSGTDYARQGLQSYFEFDFISLGKVFLLNSVLFSYVILYDLHTGEISELLDTIKKVPQDYFTFKQLILAPLIEELYFRLVFLLLVDRSLWGSSWIYAVFSSLWFGASHIKFGSFQRNVQMFIMTFVFGFYASYVMLRTQNLWCCFLLHAYCNLLGPPQPLPENISTIDAKILRSVLFGGIVAFFVLAFFL